MGLVEFDFREALGKSDGDDTIEDSDLQGEIRWDDQVVIGGRWVAGAEGAGGIYRDESGEFTYTHYLNRTTNQYDLIIQRADGDYIRKKKETMSNVMRTYFENAQLSTTAYAALFQGMNRSDYIEALKTAGMSESQAAHFADTYSILDQFTDPTGRSSRPSRSSFWCRRWRRLRRSFRPV